MAVESDCVSAPDGGEVLIKQELESMTDCFEEHSAAMTSSNEQRGKEECSGLTNVSAVNTLTYSLKDRCNELLVDGIDKYLFCLYR